MVKNFEQRIERPKISSLAEVPAIQESKNQMITRRDQIKDFVERPLLGACEDMWDKNIRTLSTSANKEDIEVGEAYIIIDFDSLSEENKKVAQKLAEPMDYDGMRAVKIIIPVSETITTDDISQRAAEIAGAFKKQPATWVPKYTLAYLKKVFRIDPKDTRFDDPRAWKRYLLLRSTGKSVLHEQGTL